LNYVAGESDGGTKKPTFSGRGVDLSASTGKNEIQTPLIRKKSFAGGKMQEKNIASDPFCSKPFRGEVPAFVASQKPTADRETKTAGGSVRENQDHRVKDMLTGSVTKKKRGGNWEFVPAKYLTAK